MVKITCPKLFLAAQKLAAENNDETFNNCIARLFKMAAGENCREQELNLTISSDIGATEENPSFLFGLEREEWVFAQGYQTFPFLNGGIIFHGFPESGYRVNNSVSLSPSYGWQIHT